MVIPSPSLALLADENAAVGVRRIVATLVDDAMMRLDNVHDLGVEGVVHETRKRCKEARGVVRLARGALGEDRFRAANGVLRDAARLLSDLRDKHAMLGTFDALVNASVGDIPADGVGPVRSALRERSMVAGRPTRLRAGKLVAAHRMLGHARRQVDDWDVAGDDATVLRYGLELTYSRARQGMEAAEVSDDPHVLHDWRKRVKYGWYHAEVLRPAAPSVLEPLATMRHRLSNGLGDLHDLDVIVEIARSSPDEFGGPDQVDAVESIAVPMRDELRRRVLTLGRRLYAETPEAHADRLLGYLAAWRQGGGELQVDEIAELFQPDDALSALTKVELLDRARTADITGRWSMDRQELLAALRASGVRS